jgi:hypothetical protein
MPDDLTETFGDVICEIQGDLSLREFAELAGEFTPANVNDWLKSRPPRIKVLVQVVEALEEAESLTPTQRERLFRAAGYVDPRRDRGGGSGSPFNAPAPEAAPDLKGYFASRQPQEPSLDRLLRLYGELLKSCQAEGRPVPPLDAGSLGGWETLTTEQVDDYIGLLRAEATRTGKRRR